MTLDFDFEKDTYDKPAEFWEHKYPQNRSMLLVV